MIKIEITDSRLLTKEILTFITQYMQELEDQLFIKYLSKDQNTQSTSIPIIFKCN